MTEHPIEPAQSVLPWFEVPVSWSAGGEKVQVEDGSV